MELQVFLASLVSGGATYGVAGWLLREFDEWERMSRRGRFFVVMGLCLAIAGGAYLAQVWFGYVTFDENEMFAAFAAAFTVSQTLWGALESGKKPEKKPVNDDSTGVSQ